MAAGAAPALPNRHHALLPTAVAVHDDGCRREVLPGQRRHRRPLPLADLQQDRTAGPQMRRGLGQETTDGRQPVFAAVQGGPRLVEANFGW